MEMMMATFGRGEGLFGNSREFPPSVCSWQFVLYFCCIFVLFWKPAVADIDESHDDKDGEGDGEEEEQHGGDHLGQRADLLNVELGQK